MNNAKIYLEISADIVKHAGFAFLIAGGISGIPILSGCSSSTKPNPEPEPENALSDNTVVLNRADISYYSPETGEITFERETVLRPGDIVASDTIHIKAPRGFLRKVAEVDGIIVSTEPATIEEAVKNCSVHKSVNLKPSNAMFTPAHDVKARFYSPGADNFDFAIDFEKYFYGGPEVDFVEASGHINFNLGYAVDLYIKNNNIENFKFLIVMDDDVKIRLQSTIETAIDKEFKIGEFILGCFVMYVPGTSFPIVMKPNLSVYIGADGGASRHFDATAARTAIFEAGLEYDSGWKTVKNYNNEFGFIYGFSDDIDLNCRVQAITNCFFYGISGLSAAVDTYLDALITPVDGEIRGGLEVSADINPEILSGSVPGYSNQIFRLEELLWEKE